MIRFEMFRGRICTHWIHIVAVLVFLPNFAFAQRGSGHPPDWMIRGTEAAVRDPLAVRATASVLAGGLLERAPPGDRVGGVIDKLLPLLRDPDDDARRATAKALGWLPPGDRADKVID